MFNAFCCSFVNSILDVAVAPAERLSAIGRGIILPLNALSSPFVTSFAKSTTAFLPDSLDKSIFLNFRETSVLPASSPKASI